MPRRDPLGQKLAELPHGARDDPAADECRRKAWEGLFGAPTSPSGDPSPDASAPEEPPPRRFGRFIDLGPLGEGGMGTVRRAHDERLHREVAIKLVGARMRQRGSDRLLREAQALARLSHPNVVQVYDADHVQGGDHEIYIAMELIEGISLDHWQRERRSWRDCLMAYVQAGRGLAAAHAAGLIHRDFKPSNCMRQSTGRVVVLDFGLARAVEPGDSQSDAVACSASTSAGSSNSLLHEQVTAEGEVPGTLLYVAPEQYAARRVDARSDQFSFCIALYEALYGQQPFEGKRRRVLAEMARGLELHPIVPATSRGVPRSIQRALRRGLSADPDQRWPTMTALLDRLERPLHTRWWRAPATIVAGGLVLTVAWLADRDPCQDTQDDLDPIWGEPQRQQVDRALRATGAPHARHTSRRVGEVLDASAVRWREARLELCRAEPGTPAQDSGLARRRRCLERQRVSLAHAVELLSQADLGLADKAVDLVTALPPSSTCSEAREPSSSATHEPRAQKILLALERAHTLNAAAQPEAGLELARWAVATARPLDDQALLARALLAEGALLESSARSDASQTRLEAQAQTALEHAYQMALESGADEVDIEARSLLGELLMDLTFMEDAVHMAERPAIAPRTRAMALTSWGNVLVEKNHLAEAQDHYERAIEALEHEYGNDHPALAAPLDGLAQVLRRQGQREQAIEVRRRALTIDRHWRGDLHPNTAMTLSNLATLLWGEGEEHEARRLLEEAITILELRWPTHQNLAQAHNGLGGVLHKREPARAEEHYREALRIWEHHHGPTHPHVVKARISLAGLLRKRDRLDEARIEYERVLRSLELDQHNPELAEIAAQAHRGLGSIRMEQGHYFEAERHYLDGIDGLRREGGESTSMMASLLNHRGHLARQLGDHARAMELYLEALGLYTAAEGGPHHAKLAQTRLNLARTFIAQQRWSDAAQQVKEVRRLHALLGPRAPDRAVDEVGTLGEAIERGLQARSQGT